MHYLYVLKDSNNKLYTGITNNLKRRLKEHIKNKVWTTKRMNKINLIFYEAFKSKYDAIKREKYLKTSKGKRVLKLMLKYSLK